VPTDSAPGLAFLLLSVLRALLELAGLFLLGQAALYVLAGPHREANAVYKLFRLLTRPVIAVARFIAPKTMAASRIHILAFVVIFVLWILLAYLRQRLA
jgi:hypothetical protein